MLIPIAIGIAVIFLIASVPTIKSQQLHRSKIYYILIVLLMISVVATSKYIELRNKYTISTAVTYQLTLNSLDRIQYHENIGTGEDMQNFYKKVEDVYQHMDFLKTQMSDTSLVDKSYKSQLNASIEKLSNELEGFVLYHSKLFAVTDKKDIVPLNEYNLLQSELQDFINYFSSNSTSSAYRFGFLEYKLYLDGEAVANVEKTVNNISEIVYRITSENTDESD